MSQLRAEHRGEKADAAATPHDPAIAAASEPPAVDSDAARAAPADTGSGETGSGEHGSNEIGSGEVRVGRIELGTAEAPPIRPTPPARGGAAARWLAGILVLVIAGALASPWWAPPLAPLLPWGASETVADATARGQLADRVAALDQRLAAAQQQVAQLQQTASERGAPAAVDLTPLRDAEQHQAAAEAQLADRLSALEGKLGQLPTVDPAAVQTLQENVGKLGGDLGALSDRVAKLAAAEPGDRNADQALLLALDQLRQKMEGSGPFPDALAAASALAKDRPDAKAVLAGLSGAAATGVPSLAVLREHFERAAGGIANADAADSPDIGGRILGNFRALLGARRVGAAAASGPEAQVATADAALRAGDLGGAVAALGTLQGAAAAAAKPWLDEAQRRLDATAALDKASAIVTARLGQEGPPAQAGEAAGTQP